MKHHGKNKESSYLKYWDVNNSYGWVISQKLPVNNFQWIEDTSQFNKDFIKPITKKVMKHIFSKLMFNILKNYINFMKKEPEIMKTENVEKVVTNLHDKTEHVIHIRNVKQAINHESVLKKVHRVIKCKQKAWLKSYIDMNTKLRKKK